MKQKNPAHAASLVIAALVLATSANAANVIVNGDFETPLTNGWTALGSGISISSTEPLAGNSSAVQTVSGGSAIYQEFTPITTTASSSFIFSATSPGTTGNRSMNVYWREDSPTNQVNLRLVDIVGNPGLGDIQVFSGVAGAGGSWQTVFTDAVTFGAPTILSLTFNSFGPGATYDLTVGSQTATGLSYFQDGAPANLSQMWFINPSQGSLKFDNVSVIPEPSAALLGGLGLLALLRRRK